MKHVGMLNFFRVLIRGGYLTELRAENQRCSQKKTVSRSRTCQRCGVRRKSSSGLRSVNRTSSTWTCRWRRWPIIPVFEILLSSYQAEGFVSGAYVAKKEFEPSEPEQIRITDQPMIHGVWPFFPRDEAGANLLTDGRHQKGRWFWRMAIGRRYGLPMAFFSKGEVDVLLMGRPEDVYAVGATYEGDAKTDNLAAHRSLYLSLFGEDMAAGESRRTQMRMVIDELGSDPAKHIALYKTFLEEVESIPRTYYIDPTK